MRNSTENIEDKIEETAQEVQNDGKQEKKIRNLEHCFRRFNIK